MKRTLLTGLVVAVAVSASAATAASAATVGQAKVGVRYAASEELADQMYEGDFDFFKASCKRRTARTFRCSFRAVIVDGAWEGSGSVTSLGSGRWRYSLKGRVEGCGNDGCVKQGTFRWKGTSGE